MQNENSSNENNKKENKYKNKILIAIIIFLLMLLICGGFFVYTTYIKNGKNTTQQINASETTNDGGQIIKDYKFDSDGKPVAVKAPNIGMAIKSAIQGDSAGHATMNIKNSGDIAIAPQVVFNGKTIYTAPTIQPGDAVEANLNFGELSTGEHDFNVLAVYQGGSELSLKSKVVVQ